MVSLLAEGEFRALEVVSFFFSRLMLYYLVLVALG